MKKEEWGFKEMVVEGEQTEQREKEREKNISID